VRIASVYRNFREPKDFETVLGELSGEEAVAVADAEKVPEPAPAPEPAPQEK
jgi:transcriptional repressor NrdR